MRALIVPALAIFLGGVFSSAAAQLQPCPPRPGRGAIISDAEELQSQNGVLTVDLTMKNLAPTGQPAEYCYVYTDGTEAPTLVVNPGDQLVLNLTNQNGDTAAPFTLLPPPSQNSDCAGGAMTATSTNIHFHGLNIPPICHQDDVIKTLVQP